MRNPSRLGGYGLIVVLLISAPAFAKPNFTGVWVRDPGGCDPYTAVVAPLIGTGRYRPGRNFILRINHRGKSLQLTVEQDGRKPATTTYDLGPGWHGNVGPQFGGSRYRPKWNGDTLTIERYATYRGYDEGVRGNVYQEWALSQAGNTLTITTAAQPNTGVTKEVFRKR